MIITELLIKMSYTRIYVLLEKIMKGDLEWKSGFY